MSVGTNKDRHTSGRRQNEEAAPFLVEEIPRSPIMRGRKPNPEERFLVEDIPSSPVMRGRRQNSDEERFLVKDMNRSPVMRGRRQNSEEKRFLVEDMNRSPVMRGRVPRVVPSAVPTVESHNKPTSSMSPGWSPDVSDNSTTTNAHAHGPPDNEDAPPSYESAIPPFHIGLSVGDTNTFQYPPESPYPPIPLSPMAKSYMSIDSTMSRSPIRSVSPSPSPSPDRLRPAYAHQYRAINIVRTPTRPIYTRTSVDDHEQSTTKPRNEFSYKYGAVIIAIFFVTFLMLLSLIVKFLIRNSFT